MNRTKASCTTSGEGVLELLDTPCTPERLPLAATPFPPVLALRGTRARTLRKRKMGAERRCPSAAALLVAVAVIWTGVRPAGGAYFVPVDQQRGGGVAEVASAPVPDNGLDGGAEAGAAGGAGAGGRSIESAAAECSSNNATESRLACFGARMLARAMDSLLSQKRYKFSDDVEIVEVEKREGGRSLGAGEEGEERAGGSPFAEVVRKMKSFLKSHEIRLRFPSLSSLPLDFKSLLNNETLPNALDLLNRVGFTRQVMSSVGTGRGKNKGGGALAAAMMMSAATIGAVGLKGIGLLALKALALSSAAFVLSLVAALKKLVSKDDEGGGGHYVQYVPLHHSGHHRRSLDLPYRAHSAEAT